MYQFQKELLVFYKGCNSEIEKKFACNNKDCKNSFCDNEEHDLTYVKDPIGIHLISLSIFEIDIDKSFKKLKVISDKVNHSLHRSDAGLISSRRTGKKRSKSNVQKSTLSIQRSNSSQINEPSCSLQTIGQNSSQIGQHQNVRLSKRQLELLYKPACKIPSYPEKYPLLNTFRTTERRRMLLQSKTELSKPEINSQLEKFVQIVIAQTGYQEAEEIAIFYLIKIANKFLEEISGMMKVYHQTNDLIDLVNFIFSKVRYGGICGIHDFYLRTILVPHDELYAICVKKRKKYEDLKKEIINKLKTCKN